MPYGVSADRKLVNQFLRICELTGCEDPKFMNHAASKNIVNLFWKTDNELSKYDLDACERQVFRKLVNKKRGTILVDGAHVEAYMAEMAHELTKMRRTDPNIDCNHPYVTLCKAYIEKIVREIKIFITGKLTEDMHQSEKAVENKDQARPQLDLS